MSRKKFQQLRLALFVNSYCGHRLAKLLRIKYEKDRMAANLEVKILAHALNLKRWPLVEAIRKGKCFRRLLCPKMFTFPKDTAEIPIFLAVEKEIVEILERRFLEDLLEVGDYQGAVLESAIERAAGNNLAEVENDRQFEEQLEELKRHDRSFYYHVAYRYKLPTIRILPFILRLITP